MDQIFSRLNAPTAIDPTDNVRVNEILNLMGSPGASGEHMPPTQTQALTKTIQIYHFNNDTSEMVRQRALAGLLLCPHSEDGDRNKWLSFVLSATCMFFPEMVEKIRSQNITDFLLTPLPESYLNSCVLAHQYHQAPSVTDRSEEDDMAPPIVYPSGLPNATDCDYNYEMALASSDPDNLYAWYALIVFLCGKRVTAQNRLSMTKNRPTALINQFALSESEYILTGNGRLTDDSHTWINNAWSRADSVRPLIIEHFCALTAGAPKNRSVAILKNTFSLLQWANCHHVPMVVSMITSHPWIIDDPMFASAYMHFRESLLRLNRVPLVSRPYVKMAYRENAPIFVRKKMSSLTACAIVWASRESESIKNYTIPPNQQQALQRFTTKLQEAGVTLQVDPNHAVASNAV